MGIACLGPLSDEYALLVEDVMRVACMHAAIHVMLLMEGSGHHRVVDRRALALLLYALLGVAVYHLIVRRLVTVRQTHCGDYKQARVQTRDSR